MSENVSFIQGSKENYNPSEMAGGVFFSKNTKEILLNGESYGNAVKADEEDVTNENGLLKLKNRSALNGMGYVILRKNKSFAEQVTKSNTIYEVRYDFEVGGTKSNPITIQNGCIIKFNGGRLSNGIIKMNDTNFMNLLDNVFENVLFTGTCLVENIKATYFGLHPQQAEDALINQQDKFECLSSFIRTMYNCRLSFDNGCYCYGGEGDYQDSYVGNKNYGTYWHNGLLIHNCPQLKSLNIDGKGSTFYNLGNNHIGLWERDGNIFTPASSIDDNNKVVGGSWLNVRTVGNIKTIAMESITVKNLSIECKVNDFIFGGLDNSAQTGYGIVITSRADHVVISNVNIRHCLTDGINLNYSGDNASCLIENCNISYCGRQNISVSSMKNINIDGCKLSEAGWVIAEQTTVYLDSPGYAIDFEPIYGYGFNSESVVVKNCEFKNCANAYIGFANKLSGYNKKAFVQNCTFSSTRKAYQLAEGNKIQKNYLPYVLTGCTSELLKVEDINLYNTGLPIDTITQGNEGFVDHLNVIINRVNIDTTDVEFKESIFALDLHPSLFDKIYLQIGDIIINQRKNVILSLFSNTKMPELVTQKVIFNNLIINYYGNGSESLYRSPSTEGENIQLLYNKFNPINNITIIDHTQGLSPRQINGLGYMVKRIDYIKTNDDANAFCLNSTRTLYNASNRNSQLKGKFGSYLSDPFNFIRLSDGKNKEVLFGAAEEKTDANIISKMPEHSLLYRGANKLTDCLFGVVESGTINTFYGEKKGVPFISWNGTTDISSYTPIVGEVIYRTDLNKPTWWTGKKWVDATGADV